MTVLPSAKGISLALYWSTHILYFILRETRTFYYLNITGQTIIDIFFVFDKETSSLNLFLHLNKIDLILFQLWPFWVVQFAK
jgi:hypothetical protein